MNEEYNQRDSAESCYPNEDESNRLAARYGEQETPPFDRKTSQTAKPTPALKLEATNEDRAATLYPDDVPGAVKDEPVHGAPDLGYKITPPEGLVMSGAIMDEIAPVFRDLNLSNAGAAKLMPLAASFHKRILSGQVEQHALAAREWQKEVMADPDLGRGNWDETAGHVARALKAAGDDPDLNELLETSRLGDHPAIIRAFRNIGRKLAQSR